MNTENPNRVSDAFLPTRRALGFVAMFALGAVLIQVPSAAASATWHSGTSYSGDPTFNAVPGLARSGNILLVPVWTTGIKVYDIVAPGQVVEITEVPATDVFGLVIQGDYAYSLSKGPGLSVIDISDPGSAHIVGGIPGFYGSRMVCRGDYLYVDSQNSIVTIDISNPEDPSITSEVGQFSRGIAVWGGMLYDLRDDGIWVFDLATPGKPVEIELIFPETGLSCMTGDQNHLYLCGGALGVRILEIDMNGELTEVASAAVEFQNSVVVDGGMMAVTSAFGTQFVDVSDPEYPILGPRVGGVSVGGSVFVDGFAYLGAGRQGLQIFDLADFTEVMPSVTFPEWVVSRILPFGEHVIVLDGTAVRILDASDPLAPVAVASLDYPSNIAVSDRYLYLKSPEGFVQVVDLAQPENPVVLGSAKTEMFPEKIVFGGGRVYLYRYSDVSIFDVTDPMNPTHIDLYDNGYSIWDIVADEDNLYILQNPFFGGWVTKYDFSDPTDPVFLNLLVLPHPGKTIAKGNGRLYAGSSLGITSIDLATFEEIDYVGDHNFAEVDISVGSDGRIYSRNGDGGFFIFSDTAGLRLEVSGTTPEMDLQWRLAGIQGLLYIPGTTGLHVYDLFPEPSSLPAHPATASISRFRSAPNPTMGHAEFSWQQEASGSNETDTFHSDQIDVLEIFDTSGRRLRTIPRRSNEHTVNWDGRDAQGIQVPSGVYFVRVVSEFGTVEGSIRVVR